MSEQSNEYRDQLYGMARIHDLRGETEIARVYYDSLIVALKDDVETSPNDFHHMGNLALVYMLIGDHAEAIRYGHMAMEEMPISTCHW